MQQTKKPVMIYSEQTPNPESLKFVTNEIVYQGIAEFKDAQSAEQWSPLAHSLFALPYVKNVYISNNYITVSKEMNFSWEDIMVPLKTHIKAFLETGDTVIEEAYEAEQLRQSAEENTSIKYSEDDQAIVTKIIDLINTYVKPAVEMDGGNIAFKAYKKGVVFVELQGACSGCPSSTVTLKSGIEGMLKRMVPEVTEVVAEMG